MRLRDAARIIEGWSLPPSRAAVDAFLAEERLCATSLGLGELYTRDLEDEDAGSPHENL
jgi:hypothetical protein